MEVTKWIILHGLNTRLNKTKGLWVEELYPILWAYRTTPRISMEESSFNLVYGTEAMIPLDIRLPSARVEQYYELSNSECQRVDLELLSEVWQQAQVQMAAYQQKVVWCYNAKVKSKVFRLEDLILRKIEVSRPLD